MAGIRNSKQGLILTVNTDSLTHLQKTITSIANDDLEAILRRTVNIVGARVDHFIRNRLADSLGVPEQLIQHRLHLHRADTRQHEIISSWVWAGKKDLSGTRLARAVGTKFTPGKVRVGKYIWRDGFWGSDKNPIVNGVLMFRVNHDERNPIRGAMVKDMDTIVQQSIDAITPRISWHLESVLTKQIDAHLAKL